LTPVATPRRLSAPVVTPVGTPRGESSRNQEVTASGGLALKPHTDRRSSIGCSRDLIALPTASTPRLANRSSTTTCYGVSTNPAATPRSSGRCSAVLPPEATSFAVSNALLDADRPLSQTWPVPLSADKRRSSAAGPSDAVAVARTMADESNTRTLPNRRYSAGRLSDPMSAIPSLANFPASFPEPAAATSQLFSSHVATPRRVISLRDLSAATRQPAVKEKKISADGLGPPSTCMVAIDRLRSKSIDATGLSCEDRQRASSGLSATLMTTLTPRRHSTAAPTVHAKIVLGDHHTREQRTKDEADSRSYSSFYADAMARYHDEATPVVASSVLASVEQPPAAALAEQQWKPAEITPRGVCGGKVAAKQLGSCETSAAVPSAVVAARRSSSGSYGGTSASATVRQSSSVNALLSHSQAGQRRAKPSDMPRRGSTLAARVGSGGNFLGESKSRGSLPTQQWQ